MFLLQHCTLVLVNTRSKKYESTEPCQLEHALNLEKRKQRTMKGNLFLIANPFKIKKIRKTLSNVHLCLEIGPSSSGQNVEGICKKQRHRFCRMQDAWIFLVDESSSAEIDIFHKRFLRKKTKMVVGKVEYPLAKTAFA
jgi:hypothetical protein